MNKGIQALKMGCNKLLCEVYYTSFPNIFLDVGEYSVGDGCLYTGEDAR
jgi:hypothetical protein